MAPFKAVLVESKVFHAVLAILVLVSTTGSIVYGLVLNFVIHFGWWYHGEIHTKVASEEASILFIAFCGGGGGHASRKAPSM